MKPIILPTLLGLLCTAFTLAPEKKKESSEPPAVIVSPVNTVTEPDACSIFTSIQLDQYGLSEKAFIHAWKGYQYCLFIYHPDNNYLTHSKILND